MQTHRQSVFSTIHTEGAILPPDLLQRIANGDPQLDGLEPESYHLLKDERINEAINRSWSRLESAWMTFKKAKELLPQNDFGTTITRERWLLPLFQELGYGRLIIAKAMELKGRTYPISHQWQNTPIHLVGGFLAHSGNIQLKEKLKSGELGKQDYYRQILRLVYRLLFLFVAEDRNLLLDPDCDEKTRQRYMQFYSLARIRRLAEKHKGTRHSDLYYGIRLVYNVPRKLDNTLRWIFYKKYVRFLNENVLLKIQQGEHVDDHKKKL